jgi:hypothetical protein
MLIDVAKEIALREIAELRQVKFAKTSSRSILGSLNEISLHYQLTAGRDTVDMAPRLSEVELQLSQTLHKRLDYVYPARVARRLLAEFYARSET